MCKNTKILWGVGSLENEVKNPSHITKKTQVTYLHTHASACILHTHICIHIQSYLCTHYTHTVHMTTDMPHIPEWSAWQN